MQKFTQHTGRTVALDRANIDTDQIVPKKFLLSVERTGFDKALFYDWRYHPDGTPREDFVFNDERYRGATILLTGANFGCGSSREHAPWALLEYGLRVIIAPSFAEIFYSNCFKIGLLPIVFDEPTVVRLIENSRTQTGYRLTVDLKKRSVADDFSFHKSFALDEFRRDCLLSGLDEIDRTLRHEEKIVRFEKNSRPTFQNS